ncbi:MAG TPA: DJ-1/PfpI family protein [Legionella sp.]|nr:DJ-1/PfpI family protein [Legionella sp.]
MKTLGVLLFPGFETLDVFGPIEIFGLLPEQFKIVLIAQNQGLIKSVQGQSVFAEYDFTNVTELNYLLVPGGLGTRTEIDNSTLIAWIKAQSVKLELVLSVCTGAALLAKAGVLDGHKATTNKIAFNWVAKQGPDVDWIKKARWVDDGKYITSSGISAGIDMSLYVVSRQLGTEVAASVAQRAEYTMNLNADNDPFMID